jgi:hypothetical protein
MATKRGAKPTRQAGKLRSLRAMGLDAKQAKGIKGGIGSATVGAGAGKVKFNEFTVKKTTDTTTP